MTQQDWQQLLTLLRSIGLNVIDANTTTGEIRLQVPKHML